MFYNGMTSNATSVDDKEIMMNEILKYFEWKDEPPSSLFKQNTWILYGYLAICVHGFIMNGFLVRLKVKLKFII